MYLVTIQLEVFEDTKEAAKEQAVEYLRQLTVIKDSEVKEL